MIQIHWWILGVKRLRWIKRLIRIIHRVQLGCVVYLLLYYVEVVVNVLGLILLLVDSKIRALSWLLGHDSSIWCFYKFWLRINIHRTFIWIAIRWWFVLSFAPYVICVLQRNSIAGALRLVQRFIQIIIELSCDSTSGSCSSTCWSCYTWLVLNGWVHRIHLWFELVIFHWIICSTQVSQIIGWILIIGISKRRFVSIHFSKM